MKRVFTGIVLSSIAGICMAQAVSVGRAEVKLPGDNWQSFPIGKEITSFGGDVSGQIDSERKIFVKKSPSNAVQAIVLISASTGRGGPGVLEYSPTCPSDKYWYRQGNEGFSRPFAECWGVLKGEPIALESLQGLVPELSAISSKEKPEMSKAAYTVFSSYKNQNGTFLTVKMFIASDFSLPTPSASEMMAEGVEGKVLRYGIALSEAVRTSVTSWSGVLVMPNFGFAQP